jgi:hypothetical protein
MSNPNIIRFYPLNNYIGKFKGLRVLNNIFV